MYGVEGLRVIRVKGLGFRGHSGAANGVTQTRELRSPRTRRKGPAKHV